jgi:site-specific DNA recombinase
MKPQVTRRRCAIYTRKSSEEGLDQAFNSLQAQREACEAYALSQRHEGWEVFKKTYDDGGFSGGNTDRPALKELLEDIRQHKIDVVIVYKVDRLSRSLADFVRLVELFDQQSVSFVSVTQQFNTSTSMGRLTLNVLLSFAQFEREVTSERIKDKLAASRKKGMWMGGRVPLGYEAVNKQLVVNEDEAKLVRHIHARYLALGCVRRLRTELNEQGYMSKPRLYQGKQFGSKRFSRGALYHVLRNPLYIGKVAQDNVLFEGAHKAILDQALWGSVQAQFKSNQNRHVFRTDAKDPSLLAGLLFDDKGNRMSPSGTKKGNRRYRSYVSQAVLQYRENEAGSVSRISASTIESIVIQQLLNLLKNPNHLYDVIGKPPMGANEQKNLYERAALIAADWNKHEPTTHLRILGEVLEKATVGRTEVVVIFNKKGLSSLLHLSDIPELIDQLRAVYEIRVPVSLKRRPQEARLIVGTGEQQPLPAGSAAVLREALLKAMTWNSELIENAVATMHEIAVREGVTQRYIAHILELSAMAPERIIRIAEGDTPEEPDLTRLKRGIAPDWNSKIS